MRRVCLAGLLISVMVGGAGCGDGEETATTEPATATAADDTVGPDMDDLSGDEPASSLSMDRETIGAWADEFAGISQATQQAWDSRDLDAIRGLYTEDIVHHDDRFSTHREGIDDVMGIADAMFTYQTPEVRFAASPEFGRGFIGGEGGIMVWEAYDALGYTKESPLVEVDRLTVRDGLIAYWELLYETRNPHDVITAYATAWTSGDPVQVAAVYEPSAVREDAILGSLAEGVEALKATAAGFFADHPGATWELLLSFGAGNTHGGLFAITDDSGCPVRTAVLARIDSGRIVGEEIYYEATSLLACDWLS